MTGKAAFFRRCLLTVSAVAGAAMAVGYSGSASAAGFDSRMTMAGRGTVLACNFNGMAIKYMGEVDYPELRMKPVMTMDYPGGEIAGRGGIRFAGGMSDEEYIDSLLDRFRSKGKSLPGDRERHDRHLERILRKLIESQGLEIKASAAGASGADSAFMAMVGGCPVAGPGIIGAMTMMGAGVPDRWGAAEWTSPCLPDATVRSLVAGGSDRLDISLDGPCPCPPCPLPRIAIIASEASMGAAASGTKVAGPERGAMTLMAAGMPGRRGAAEWTSPSVQGAVADLDGMSPGGPGPWPLPCSPPQPWIEARMAAGWAAAAGDDEDPPFPLPLSGAGATACTHFISARPRRAPRPACSPESGGRPGPACPRPATAGPAFR